MPCRNSSGKVASEASGTPRARSPFQVKATVTHRESVAPPDPTTRPVPTLSMMPESQARPPAGCRKVRNPYRAARARGRASRKCWTSSSSSTALPPDRSLHLVEHAGESRLQPQGLLDLVGTHIGVLAVFQEAGALVVAHELDERSGVRLPVLREPFKVLKDRPEAGPREDAYGVFGVLVEVGVEDALVHEVGVLADVEEHPAQVVELQHGEEVRRLGHPLLDPLGVRIEILLGAGLDPGKDAEAVAGRSLGVDRAVASLLYLIREESPFGDRQGSGFRPVVLHVRLPFLVPGFAQLTRLAARRHGPPSPTAALQP